MGTAIPVVHALQYGLGLVNREHRALTDYIEIAVCDDRGDFYYGVRVGTQTRHLEIDPDQCIRVLRHAFSRSRLIKEGPRPVVALYHTGQTAAYGAATYQGLRAGLRPEAEGPGGFRPRFIPVYKGPWGTQFSRRVLYASANARARRTRQHAC